MAGKKSLLPPRKRWRALFAFVVSPLVVALLATALGFSISYANGDRDFNAETMGQIWMVFWLFGLVFSLIYVWPMQAVAFRRRWRRAPTYIIAGAIGGLPIGVGLFSLFLMQAGVSAEMSKPLMWLLALLLFAAITVIPATLMAWLFWLIRRPDRDKDSDPVSVFD